MGSHVAAVCLRTCMRGLVGDSTISIFVLPGIMARLTASRSVRSTLLTDTPAAGTTCRSSRHVAYERITHQHTSI